MGVMKGFATRLRALLRTAATDRELDEEIALHLELETTKFVALGFTPVEARRRALAAFGGVTRVREDHREARSARWIEETRRDIRLAFRAVARTPTVSGAAILTLALAIGANVAIFSAVHAVLLRPLPFANPGRLVMLWEENPDRGWHRASVAPANMLDWRERVGGFADVAAYAEFLSAVTHTGADEPQLLQAVTVTGNFFDVLGVRAHQGRLLRDEETWQTGERVVVVSHRAWRDRFGADPNLVGGTIVLNDQPVRIIGVAPPSFTFPDEDVDVWTPAAWDPADRGATWFRRAHWMRAIARLDAGVSLEEANAQLQHVAQQLMQEYPVTNTRMGAGLTPLHEFLVGSTRTPLLVLLAAVGILLVLACANVGTLLLLGAAARQRETALRLVLGAGRLRVARQALVESLVLAVLGGAAGLALGWAGIRALTRLQPAGMLPVGDIAIDWSILGFVLLVTAGSGVLFGVGSAVWHGRRTPGDAVRSGGRSATDDRRTSRWGGTLVVTEVALALLLSVAAGLLVRSVWELQHVHPGFDAEDVLTATVGLPGARYDTVEKVDAFWSALVERARALPGVQSAAVVRQLPLTTPSWSSSFTAEGWPPERFGADVVHREMSPGYFATMRVPVQRGRAFTIADDDGAQRVVVINDVLARSFFPGEDPIGRRIAFDQVADSSSIWRTIVGVVGSERQGALAAEPRPEIFAPVAQDRTNRMSLVLRAADEPAALAPAVRRVIADLDPRLAIATIRTMEDVRAEALARDRFLMALLLCFAVAGLVLAFVGVYGVLAQLVTRRLREIGIRIALGAQPTAVRWQVVRQSLVLTIVGLALGAGAALLGTRALAPLLYRVATADARTYLAVIVVLTAASALAAWWPATRASRADPLSVMRGD